MTEHLPEFSDDLAHCDACDWSDARTEYVPADAAWLGVTRVDEYGQKWPGGAYLKRTCNRCGYAWPEATRKDKPAVEEQGCGSCNGTGETRDRVKRPIPCPYCDPDRKRH